MRIRSFLLLVTILSMSGYTAQEATSIDEPLAKLSMISRLLNAISIQNGFFSGYPNIYDSVSEILNFPTRNSLLKFLDLELESLPEDVMEFEKSMESLGNLTIENPDELTDHIWFLVGLKKKQRMMSTFLKDFKSETENRLNTFNSIVYSFNYLLDSYYFQQSLKYLNSEKNITSLDIELGRSLNKLKDMSEYKSKFELLDNLVVVRKDSKALLDSDVQKFREEFNITINGLYLLNESISNIAIASRVQKSMFMLAMNLRNTMAMISKVTPLKSIDESNIIKNSKDLATNLINPWMETQFGRGETLENDIQPFLTLTTKMEKLRETLEKRSAQLVTDQYYKSLIENIQIVFGHGDQLQVFSNLEESIESSIECIGKGRYQKRQELTGELLNFMSFVENPSVEDVKKRFGDAMLKMSSTHSFEKIMDAFVIVKNVASNYNKNEIEGFEVIRNLTETRQVVMDTCETAVSTMDPIRITFQTIFFDFSSIPEEFNIFNESNLTEVAKCIDYSSVYKLTNAINYVKSLSDVKSSKPNLGNLTEFLEELFYFQKELRSTIDWTLRFGKSTFHGITNIHQIAKTFGEGVQGLESIQSILQNKESIRKIVNWNEKIHGFKDKNILEDILKDLGKINFPSGDLDDARLSDIWKSVSDEALKIQNLKFSKISDDVIKRNNQSGILDSLKVVSSLDMDMGKHLERIRKASGMLEEVESTLEQIFKTEEEEKKKVNPEVTVEEERVVEKSTPVVKHFSWTYFFRVFYMEIIFVFILIGVPFGSWVIEKYQSIQSKKDT